MEPVVGVALSVGGTFDKVIGLYTIDDVQDEETRPIHIPVEIKSIVGFMVEGAAVTSDDSFQLKVNNVVKLTASAGGVWVEADVPLVIHEGDTCVPVVGTLAGGTGWAHCYIRFSRSA